MARESSDTRHARASGKVRAARLTDLPALGELSRIAQTEGSGSRTLGLPVNGPPIGVFSLFRLPLVAVRPHDLLFVYESERHVAGLVRVERDAWRDDWTIVELDAIGPCVPGTGSGPGEIPHRPGQQILAQGWGRAGPGGRYRPRSWPERAKPACMNSSTLSSASAHATWKRAAPRFWPSRRICWTRR